MAESLWYQLVYRQTSRTKISHGSIRQIYPLCFPGDFSTQRWGELDAGDFRSQFEANGPGLWLYCAWGSWTKTVSGERGRGRGVGCVDFVCVANNESVRREFPTTTRDGFFFPEVPFFGTKTFIFFEQKRTRETSEMYSQNAKKNDTPVSIQTPPEVRYDWTPKTYTSNTAHLMRYDWMSRGMLHGSVQNFLWIFCNGVFCNK